MENRQQISEELKAISPLLAGMGAINPYQVPEGYFSALPQVIMDRVGMEDLLTGASANTYQAPAGYFDELPAALLARVKNIGMISEVQAELDEIAPLLNTISKQNLFSVPAGYFENTDFILATQVEKKQGKLVSIGFARRWTRYAVAAVMAGVLVTGAFIFTDNKSNFEYDKFSNINVSSELNKVSEDDLAKYLDTNEHYTAGADIALVEVGETEQAMNENEPTQVLSDEELSQYLSENTESSTVATKN